MVEKFNITLPRRWNQCTREQLELIADVMQEQILRQDRYHPFNMRNVKIALFFALSGMKIKKGVDDSKPVDERFYLCEKDGREFPLYLWQINYWLSPKADTDDKTSPEYIAQGKGMLDWIDRDSKDCLTKFVYPELKRLRCDKWWLGKRTFRGPIRDLDGFSWAQYRMANDLMHAYTDLSNSLIKMQGMGKFSPEQFQQQEESIDKAKSMFLATIFNAKTKYVDANTGLTKRDYYYETDQHEKNMEYFRHFPNTQWQVILFWWTGMMYTLSKRYRHVFKEQKINPKKKQNPDTPLEVYTATIATMQKYAGLTEDQVNNQSYSIVLEHMERIITENEEISRLSNKK